MAKAKLQPQTMGNLSILIEEVGSGYVDHALDWDDSGKGYLVICHAPDLLNNNITYAAVHVAQDGDTFELLEEFRTTVKIDSVKMTNRKKQLVLSFTEHSTSGFPRRTLVEVWTLENAWIELTGAPQNAPRPCVAPGNLPYFGVNDLVTRGQNAKITASANGLTAPDPNKQTFQDVPVGSTFHPYVEALAQNGHVSGKACE